MEDDRISSCPDPILSYILSFLPTKEVVATSVLSKRWNLLWRSVPSLDFHHDDAINIDYDEEKEVISRLLSVHNHQNRIETCIEDVLRRSSRLVHLHLSLGWFTAVPSVVFICKTLLVLKLVLVAPKNISFVDLPLLKVLHLDYVCVVDREDLLQQFLSGCLNLEDLEVNMGYSKLEELHSLPKVVRAKIDRDLVPLKIVKNFEVLVTNKIYEEDLVFGFSEFSST